MCRKNKLADALLGMIRLRLAGGRASGSSPPGINRY